MMAFLTAVIKVGGPPDTYIKIHEKKYFNFVFKKNSDALIPHPLIFHQQKIRGKLNPFGLCGFRGPLLPFS